MRQQLLLLFLLLPIFGCGGESYKVAPVSGRVTLDGKPLAKGHITFVPLGTKENQAPGPTAWSFTDADGRYKLVITPATPGAVVGKCRIFITGLDQPMLVEDDRDVGGRRPRLVRDPVLEKYNKRTELVYDVPAGGTDQANFDLKSR